MLSPPKEVHELADAVDVSCGTLLELRGNWAVSTQWEAPLHAWTLSNHALRNAEATVLMAQNDLVLFPAASATARVAMEGAGRCAWLIKPTDPWEREARWIALMDEGGRLSNRDGLPEGSPLANRAKSVAEFAAQVRSLMPPGYPVPGIPGVKTLFEDFAPRVYAYYIESSQHVHAAELTTGQWRNRLRTSGLLTETVTSLQWLAPLWMAWQAFRLTARRLISLQATTVGLRADPTEKLASADQGVRVAVEALLRAEG